MLSTSLPQWKDTLYLSIIYLQCLLIEFLLFFSKTNSCTLTKKNRQKSEYFSPPADCAFTLTDEELQADVVAGDVLAEGHQDPEVLAAPHHQLVDVVGQGPVLHHIHCLQHVHVLHPQCAGHKRPGRGPLQGLGVVVHLDQVGFRHLVGKRYNCVSSLGEI